MPCGEVGNDLVAGANRGLLARAHHQRHIRPVNVGVNQADALAQSRKRNGEIDGDGGFAHTALPGTNGDNLGDAGQCDGRGHIRCVGHDANSPLQNARLR